MQGEVYQPKQPSEHPENEIRVQIGARVYENLKLRPPRRQRAHLRPVRMKNRLELDVNLSSEMGSVDLIENDGHQRE